MILHKARKNRQLPQWARNFLSKLFECGYNHANVEFKNRVLIITLFYGRNPIELTENSILSDNPSDFNGKDNGYLLHDNSLWAILNNGIFITMFQNLQTITKFVRYRGIGLYSIWHNPEVAF